MENFSSFGKNVSRVFFLVLLPSTFLCIHKMCPRRSLVCRTAFIRNTLESPDLVILSNLGIRPLETIKVAGTQMFQIWKLLSINIQFHGRLATSKLLRSASSGYISKFDPWLDPSGPVLSGALGISAVRHTCDRMKHFF